MSRWIFGVLMGVFVFAAQAQTLKVGTAVAPPFVIEREGELTGISIELFKRVADHLGLQYEFVQTDLAGMLEGVKTGELDASIAALTVTSEREQYLDFSHPFYTTGLALATRAESGGFWAGVRRLFSVDFMLVLAVLGGLLLFVGTLLWFVEHKENQSHFGGSLAEGVGSGFWWAAVTMTTVGYGDKAPVTLPGRIIGLVWMFSAILLISGFTAAIATSLTVSSLDSRIQGIHDLPGVRVITVENSSSVEFLDSEGIRFSTEKSVQAGLAKLAVGQVDAVVYDKPLLRYLVNKEYAGKIRVLPQSFKRQDYAIAMPQGSSLREPLNRSLLEVLSRDDWPGVVARFLGE